MSGSGPSEEKIERRRRQKGGGKYKQRLTSGDSLFGLGDSLFGLLFASFGGLRHLENLKEGPHLHCALFTTT